MANEEMRRNWTAGAAGWVANEATFDRALAPVTAAIMEAAAPAPGHRVLDVGCGSGTLLAATVAAGAEAVGVDISPVMADAARDRVSEATVLVADAQVADLLGEAPGSPFDRVVSRFGVMFFEDPEAAFANLRKVASPAARLVFGCWRSKEENPLFGTGTNVLLDRLDPQPELPGPDAPGPLAFANPDRTAALLDAAGWASIAIDPLDFTCDFSAEGSDGVEERLSTILGTGSGRFARQQLEPRLGPDGWNEIVEEVRTELRRHRVDGVLRFPGAAWLVTAANPAT